MGGLNLLVTGAAGFLGRAVVEAAQARGHHVVAQSRKADSWDGDAGTLTADLFDLTRDQLQGFDSIVHCAACVEGDEGAHLRDTVAASEALIAGLPAPVHLVLAGSLSVYGCQRLMAMQSLDERTALEPFPEERDAYTRAKLAQEGLFRDAMEAGRLNLTTLRLGALYGPGRYWNGHIGQRIGPVLIRFGSRGEVPLCHVKNAAQALVLACEKPPARHRTLNIVDDDLPSRNAFVAALCKTGWPRVVLPLPVALLRLTGRLIPRRLPRPGLMRSAVIDARLKPLRYANEAAKEKLGWQPQHRFARTISAEVS